MYIQVQTFLQKKILAHPRIRFQLHWTAKSSNLIVVLFALFYTHTIAHQVYDDDDDTHIRGGGGGGRGYSVHTLLVVRSPDLLQLFCHKTRRVWEPSFVTKQL